MPFAIPDELVALFRQGRVIPFVGAGMSANVGYPSWDTLLESLGENLGQRELKHRDVVELTGNDRLRIAEYYYLTEGKQVGPIRREIDRQFGHVSPLEFGGYVDLANLGSQRIYTTNFDDLIERTYRELDIPYERIATPRDLARSAGNQTEIVKYHGDLTNDPSLVLTESQYYRRLNFDSPIDLKFRADLLGKSVMFIGYSFSDINIRIIWFRLLDMMRGVEQADLPTSYMIIMKPNPVEELLYKDAGIETIVLDPSSEYEPDQYPILVGDFLYDLVVQVCDPSIPGGSEKPFVSRTLLRRIAASNDGAAKFPRFRRGSPDMQRLSTYRLPEKHLEEALSLFPSNADTTQDAIDAAIAVYDRRREDEGIKRYLLRSALAQSHMALQDDTRIDWDSISDLRFEADMRQKILSTVRRELEYHETEFDAELFFAAYLAIEMSEGKFGAAQDDRESAGELLRQVEERYPGSVEELRNRGRGSIGELAETFRPDEEAEGDLDDLPF